MPASIAKLAILLTTDTSGMRGFGIARQEVQRFAAAAESGVLSSRMLAGGLTGAVAALAGFVAWGTRLADAADNASIKLEALTGSARQAQSLLAFTQDFGLGRFDDAEVQKASRSLLAFGVEADKIPAVLTALGNIALGTDASLTDLSTTLSRIAEDGTVGFGELNRLGKQGIPIIDQLAERFGVARSEIREMAEEGKITLSDLAAALGDMAGQGGRFGNLMERSADTFGGQWAILKDRIEDIARTAGEGFAFIGTDALKQVNTALGSMNQGIKDSAESAQQLADAFRAVEAEALAAREVEESKKRLEALRKEGEAFTKSLRTPAEIFVDSIAEMNRLLELGVITVETYERGLSRAKESLLGSLKSVRDATAPAVTAGPAATFGTSAGFSAVHAARAEMARLAELQKQQLEVEKQQLEAMHQVRDLMRKEKLVFPVAEF